MNLGYLEVMTKNGRKIRLEDFPIVRYNNKQYYEINHVLVDTQNPEINFKISPKDFEIPSQLKVIKINNKLYQEVGKYYLVPYLPHNRRVTIIMINNKAYVENNGIYYPEGMTFDRNIEPHQITMS